MVRLDVLTPRCVLVFMEARSFLREQIQTHQLYNVRLRVIMDKMLYGEAKEASLDLDGLFEDWWLSFYAKIGDWLEKGHSSRYSIQLRVTMVSHTLESD